MNALLRPGERLDDLQNGYQLIQRPDMFCLGTDSVLLTDFAAPRAGEVCVDLGCGNGAIALLLAARRADAHIDGVELQMQAADMAARSVQLNRLEARVRIFQGDMRDSAALLGHGGYSLAVCNPPYGARGATILSAGEAERIARHEGELTVQDVAAAAARLLKFGGRFCTVFPSARALEMLDAMRAAAIAPKRIRLVHARVTQPPKLALIEGVRGGKSGLHWLPPLLLYDETGAHSAEWRRIYGM